MADKNQKPTKKKVTRHYPRRHRTPVTKIPGILVQKIRVVFTRIEKKINPFYFLNVCYIQKTPPHPSTWHDNNSRFYSNIFNDFYWIPRTSPM